MFFLISKVICRGVNAEKFKTRKYENEGKKKRKREN
jgi:hypothetical protein